MKLQLYPWQSECLHTWFKHDCHGIIHVVTGAGKTVMAISAMEQLGRKLSIPLRVKIVVPQTFLTSQWAGAMQTLAGIPRQEIGYYYGAHKDSPDRPYMIYVVNSARYSLSRHILQDIRKGYAVLLVADECHHYASRENRKIFEFFPHLKDQDRYYSLGLSATPQTPGYEQFWVPALGREIYRYTFDDAAAGRNIRSFACFHISLSFTPDENNTYQELSDRLAYVSDILLKYCPSLGRLDNIRFFHKLKHLMHSAESPKLSHLAKAVLFLTYQRKSVVYNAGARIQCTLDLIQQLDPHSRIIIFGERIEQADRLYEQLNRIFPHQVGRYHSQMEAEAKKTALNRYENGESRILITCRALDEGFDIPSANVGIVLSSSSVERQRIQRLGRILRNSSGGTHIAGLYYLYVKDSSEKPFYLEEEGGNTASAAFSLTYDSRTGQFLNPAYEELMAAVLKKLKIQNKTQSAINECRRCLCLGMLRTDWLMGIPDIMKRIKEADDVREENYWFCMKMMAQALAENSVSC